MKLKTTADERAWIVGEHDHLSDDESRSICLLVDDIEALLARNAELEDEKAEWERRVKAVEALHESFKTAMQQGGHQHREFAERHFARALWILRGEVPE